MWFYFALPLSTKQSRTKGSQKSCGSQEFHRRTKVFFRKKHKMEKTGILLFVVAHFLYNCIFLFFKKKEVFVYSLFPFIIKCDCNFNALHSTYQLQKSKPNAFDTLILWELTIKNDLWSAMFKDTIIFTAMINLF